MILAIHPVTAERLGDFERLMGPKGGADGCWCMIWRQAAAAYKVNRGDVNRDLMRARIADGPPPGLIAYDGEVPVGWVSVAPRAEFPRMAGSRILAPAGAEDDWVVTCFFIARGHRGRGVGTALLEAAVTFAAGHGARQVTGYPIDPRGGRYASGFAWTGIAAAFLKAGFAEAERRSEKRPVMVRRL